LSEVDVAIRSRILLIPFTVQISEADRDPDIIRTGTISELHTGGRGPDACLWSCSMTDDARLMAMELARKYHAYLQLPPEHPNIPRPPGWCRKSPRRHRRAEALDLQTIARARPESAFVMTGIHIAASCSRAPAARSACSQTWFLAKRAAIIWAAKFPHRRPARWHKPMCRSDFRPVAADRPPGTHQGRLRCGLPAGDHR
jgi:hypothetical protein